MIKELVHIFGCELRHGENMFNTSFGISEYKNVDLTEGQFGLRLGFLTSMYLKSCETNTKNVEALWYLWENNIRI